MTRREVVFIGAGSVVFASGLIADLVTDGGEWDLRLVDIEEERLEAISGLAERLVEATSAPISLSRSTQRTDLLPDADVVVTMLDVGGRRAWEKDVNIPRKYGIHIPVADYFEGRLPIVDILCSGPGVVPLLENALAGAAGPKQILLAQALAAVGSSAGVPVLISAIEGHLSGGRLPECTAKIRHAGLPPNQCAAPDTAYLLYCLGMARDDRALPVWRRVVDLLEATTEQEVVDRYLGRYYYVDAVCYGAERLGDPRAVPVLKQLHTYAPFHGRECHSGHEVDWFKERLAHLEIVIGRSLARCGSVDGYAILMKFLDETRAVLAEHAHAELAAICGCDLGKDVAAWRAWLDQQSQDLRSVPWSAPPEPVSSWSENILIDAAAKRPGGSDSTSQQGEGSP